MEAGFPPLESLVAGAEQDGEVAAKELVGPERHLIRLTEARNRALGYLLPGVRC